MAIIKNATELSDREWYLFLKLYARYFTKDFVESNKNKTLSKLKLYMCGNGYAEQTLANIKRGTLTSFVALEKDKRTPDYLPIGFITGFETDAGMLNLCHIYAKVDRLERLRVLKGLYDRYAEAAKSHGMVNVQTTSDLFAPELTDALEGLHFEQGSIDGTEINYGRKL